MRFVDQRVEVILVAQAWVDLEVVEGVVAMRGGGKDWAERDPGRTQFDDVVQPRDDPPQPMLALPRRAGPRWGVGADEPEWVQPPPDRMADPGGLGLDELDAISAHRGGRSAR